MKRVTLAPFANELLYPIRELLSEVFLTAMSHLVESRPISLGFAQLEYMPSFGFVQSHIVCHRLDLSLLPKII